MKRIMWVLAMFLVCVSTSATTTIVLNKSSTPDVAVAAELPPAIGLCAKQDEDLDTIWPERMTKVRRALAEAEPASVILFDTNGDVLETYANEEIFLYNLWQSSLESRQQIGDLYDALDTTFATKPISWIPVHETVDRKDLDGDGKISFRDPTR